MKIFLIGFMGSGKTHWGRLLSAKLGLSFYDLDTVIVEKEKRSVSDLFAEKGEEYFRYLKKRRWSRSRSSRKALSCPVAAERPASSTISNL